MTNQPARPALNPVTLSVQLPGRHSPALCADILTDEWIPNEANLRRARVYLAQIRMRIAAGTFKFTQAFPAYRFQQRLPLALRAHSCGEVFDAFLAHEAARVTCGDLAMVTLAAHRQLLDPVWRPAIGQAPFVTVRYSQLVKTTDAHRHWSKKTYNNAISALRRAFDFSFRDHPERFDPAQTLRSARIGKKDRRAIDPFSVQDAETLIAAIHRDWGEMQGNYDEFRFFTGLRPSEQMALVVTDYDARSGLLSVSKARVAGVDHDRTKTHEDRRVVLCPRARTVLDRQLRPRERLAREGRLDHAYLFCHADGAPIRRHSEVYGRWRATLKRLAIRYRRPYAARHSSVSWNLMIGRNPLFVARQHGHSILAMLTVYAAWTDGALPAVETTAIRPAMRQSPTPVSRIQATTATGTTQVERRFATEEHARARWRRCPAVAVRAASSTVRPLHSVRRDSTGTLCPVAAIAAIGMTTQLKELATLDTKPGRAHDLRDDFFLALLVLALLRSGD